MPITISYDLTDVTTAQRTYLRSMLERFAWQRLGGTVFRYDGRIIKGHHEEDWLNDVIPSLMFFRSYAVKHGIKMKFFTLDTNSVSRIDHSDPNLRLGRRPRDGKNLLLKKPTNRQSSEKTLRGFVDTATDATVKQ